MYVITRFMIFLLAYSLEGVDLHFSFFFWNKLFYYVNKLRQLLACF